MARGRAVVEAWRWAAAPEAARRLAATMLFVAGSASAALAQDGDLVVRIGRLETQIRQLSGQLERAQFQQRKLEEQLRKFQSDTEFRFQELKPAAKATPPARGGSAASSAAPPARQ